MNRIPGTRIFLSLIFATLIGLPGVAFPDQVHVAVATNFADCLEQLGTAFAESTGHELIISRGSTGKHFAQITAGAPFDVFFAADSERPARLEADGLTVSGSRFTYAIGGLVLWMPRADPDSSASIIEVLKSPEYRHLAIANPRLAPYGLAAKQTLTSLGIWDELEPRLVMGQSIGQTWQFVATGNAQLGFVAQSQLTVSEDSPGSWWAIDADLHDLIEQQAVLMLSAAENDAAQKLMDFVRGPQARLIIKTYGYTVPED